MGGCVCVCVYVCVCVVMLRAECSELCIGFVLMLIYANGAVNVFFFLISET